MPPLRTPIFRPIPDCMNRLLPYRFAAPLLVAALLFAGASPLAGHRCAMMGPTAAAAAPAMPCHEQPAPARPASDGLGAAAPALMPCCTAPSPATPAPAVASEQTLRLASAPVLPAAVRVPPAPSVAVQGPRGASPPPHVRPHLTFSVLLI